MNTTTLFDLNKTASNAAITALGQDALGTTGIELESFTAAGHDRADFPQWQAFFQNHVKNYTTQKATLSPAAKAEQIAANAAAVAATKAAAAKTTTNANTTQASVSTTTAAAS
jgi:hypothetical protein